jgi:hypothetical protein
MISTAVCLVRFMVKSPAQSGRLRTLIHPGPVSQIQVNPTRPRQRAQLTLAITWLQGFLGEEYNATMATQVHGGVS